MPCGSGRGVTYVASGFESECLLNVCPDITVAGEVGAQLRQRLPCEHHSAIGWAIQKAPMHRLLAADPGCAGQVLHGGLGRHHVHVRVDMPRDKVHVWELNQ